MIGEPWEVTDDDDPATLIKTRVGDEVRLVPFDKFALIHQEVADDLRARGLDGDDLDNAIVAVMPMALAAAIELGPRGLAGDDFDNAIETAVSMALAVPMKDDNAITGSTATHRKH